MRLEKWILVIIVCFALVAPSEGDDGWMPQSGNEMGLSNKSVQMVREHIRITVYNRHLHAVCDFIFLNHGKPTKLTMGFPDFCDPGDSQKQVSFNQNDLYHFHSWVNGKEVVTRLVRNPREIWDSFWFEKQVSFRKGEEIWVRDSYDMPIGLEDISWSVKKGKYIQWTCHNLSYVIRTGSTWFGNIENAEIDVRFSTPGVLSPYLLHRGEVDFEKTNAKGISEIIPTSHDIWYNWNGFVDQRNNELIFKKRNFKPTYKDDLFLSFKFPI